MKVKIMFQERRPMAGKYSQSPAVGLGHGTQNQGMEGSRTSCYRNSNMKQMTNASKKRKADSESLLLQMLGRTRQSTGDLAIEVMVDMIMETGGLELDKAFDVIGQGISTAPGHDALAFLKILAGLAGAPGGRVKVEALLMLQKYVPELYYRVGAEERVRIRELVTERQEILDIGEVDRIKKGVDEIDGGDGMEWLVDGEWCSREDEGLYKRIWEKAGRPGAGKMVIVIDDRGAGMEKWEFVQKMQERTGMEVKIAVADKLMEIGEWEEEVRRAITPPGPEWLVIMAQTGDMLEYRVEQEGGKKYPQLGLNVGFDPTEYTRQLELKVGELRDRYPHVGVVLLGPPVVNLEIHNRTLRRQVGLVKDANGEDREEQKKLNNWMLKVRRDQLSNPKILYWDLTTHFLDNKRKGVPTEAFKKGRTYKPIALEKGYGLSEPGLDLFVKDIGKRVRLTEKGAAKELWDRVWKQMETELP